MPPLARYFLYVGGSLLTLLFLVDWYLPPNAVDAGQAQVDRTTIRIHSAHKWPSAVVFDTTQTTIVPPPQPASSSTVEAKAPAARKSPSDALALAQPADLPAAAAAAHLPAPKQVKRKVRVARRPASEHVASDEPSGFRPFFQMGW